MRGINKDFMFYQNRISALQYFYKESFISKKTLALKMGLSIPTISNIIKDLEDSGRLLSTGKPDKSYGQHQGYWYLNKNREYFLCLSISPYDIKSVIVGADAKPIGHIMTEPVHFKTSQEIIKGCVQTINHLTNNFPQISKIALACHGIVDSDRGISVMMPRLAEKRSFPLKEILEAETKVSIKMDNSVNAYALAEKWLGAAQRIDDFVWINIDRGVGGALVLNRELYRGHCYTAGEIGHVEVLPQGPECECGNKGCLEALVSSRRILETLREFHPSVKTIDDFCTLIQEGDKHALNIQDHIIFYLQKGLTSIVNILSPQYIFIGGTLTKLGDNFLGRLRESMTKTSIYKLHNPQEIVFSRLSEDLMLAGAAFLWIESELLTQPPSSNSPKKGTEFSLG